MLAPKLYEPFPVQARVRQVAYKLQLLARLVIHPIFYVFCPQEKLRSRSSAFLHIPPVDADGHLRVDLIAVLDHRMVKKNNKVVTRVLAQWSNASPEDATWEAMYDLRQNKDGLV